MTSDFTNPAVSGGAYFRFVFMDCGETPVASSECDPEN